MSRPLTVFLPVDSPAAFYALTGDPQWWLPQPAAAVPGGWAMPVHAGPVTHAVVCRLGPPRVGADGVWRSITWKPSDAGGRTRAIDRLLPQLSGEFGMLFAPAATLVLSASYEPPGAALGSVVDRAGLERVAESTARRFVADVAKRLAASVAADLQEAPLASR